MLTGTQCSALQTSIGLSLKKRERPVEYRRKGLREYTGNYFPDGCEQQRPLNQYQLWCNTILRTVAAKSPTPWVRPPSRDEHDFALALQWNLAEHCRLINLQDTLRDMTHDALYYGGHCKIVISHFNHPESGAYSQRPHVDYIDYEDFFQDAFAREWGKQQYRGDYYRLPKAMLEQDESYNQDVVASLSPGTLYSNSNGRLGGEPKGSEEFLPTVALRDVYLPLDNLLVTMSANDDGKYLKCVEWAGHPMGAYFRMAFLRVPGVSVPASLAMSQYDLNQGINITLNRNIEDIQNKKHLGLVEKGSGKDAGEMNDAKTNTIVGIESSSKPNMLTLGGADAADMVAIQQLVEMFSRQGNNMDSLAGLGPQANTLGQDELTKGSANMMTADLGDYVRDAARTIMRALAWYMVKGPEADYGVTKTYQGQATKVPFQDAQREQMGDLDSYHLDIEPYSMEHQTPGGQFAKLMGIFNNIVIPAAGILTAQGMMPNIMALLQYAAEYTNAPEVPNLIMPLPKPQNAQQESNDAPPPVMTPNKSSQHNYTRTSQAVTPASRGMVQKLLASQTQGAA